MKMVEGLLRYDKMDMEEWCFDKGYQVIPIESNMHLHMPLFDDRFRRMKLLETPDGQLTVVLDDRKRKNPPYFILDKGKRYSAKMPAQIVDDILDNARLHDLEHVLPCEEDSVPSTNTEDDDVFYF